MPFVLKIFFHSANISGQEKSAAAQGQPQTVGPIAFYLGGNIGAENDFGPRTDKRVTARRYDFFREYVDY